MGKNGGTYSHDRAVITQRSTPSVGSLAISLSLHSQPALNRKMLVVGGSIWAGSPDVLWLEMKG